MVRTLLRLSGAAFVVLAVLAVVVLGGNTPDSDAPGAEVMMLGAAGSVLVGTLGYRRLGWAALVLGIGLFIPFVDFFALLLTLLWIIVASIVLFRDRRELDRAAALEMA